MCKYVLGDLGAEKHPGTLVSPPLTYIHFYMHEMFLYCKLIRGTSLFDSLFWLFFMTEIFVFLNLKGNCLSSGSLLRVRRGCILGSGGGGAGVWA